MRRSPDDLRRRDADRLRVVFLDHTAKLSGGEIALLRLLPHLDRVDAIVILGEDGPLVGRLEQSGIRVLVRPLDPQAKDFRKDRAFWSGGMLRPVAGTTLYTIRLARLLHRLSPDIVHTNSLKSGVYGSVAGRLARIPVVWHLRDRIADDYLPAATAVAVRILIRSLPSAVLANSKATLGTVKAADSIIVHSVVPDLAGADQRQRPVSRSSVSVFGMVGRIAPWKGQDVFLRAFAAAFPDGPERAVLVGSAMFGEDEFGRTLAGLVGELGLTDRVEFRGFRDDVWAELDRMDVLVHASITEEPFGQVILEGLAAGLPVVASAGGGPSEILTDGVDGLLHTPGDAGALAGLLLRLRDDGPLRAGLVKAGRARAADFSPEVARDLVQGAYDRVLTR